jgi:plasmid stabilization system protein ParE
LGGNEARAAALANRVLSVLRRDGEFLQSGRPPPTPRDVFWLRFLEKKQRK